MPKTGMWIYKSFQLLFKHLQTPTLTTDCAAPLYSVYGYGKPLKFL